MWDCQSQDWLAREDGGWEEAGRHAAAATPCLFTRTPSLEQAGGLQRMTLRGHTGGISKVMLTPGGIDVITGAPLHITVKFSSKSPSAWDMHEYLIAGAFKGRALLNNGMNASLSF